MRIRFAIGLAMLVLLLNSASAQELQIQPGWTGFEDAKLESPIDADLTFEPHANVEWFAIQFKDYPEAYSIDQWSGVDPEMDGVAIPDVLVFFYDAPWDTTMKQRVQEAEVVDEEAIFPVPCETWHGVCSSGFYRSPKTALPQSAVFAPVATTSESNRYAQVPNGREPFVIIDLAETQHLGMAPGYWGAFQP